MNPTDLITTYPRLAGAIAGVLVLCVCWGAIALWRRLGRKRGGPLPWRNEMFCGFNTNASYWQPKPSPVVNDHADNSIARGDGTATPAKPAPYGSKPDESKRPVTREEYHAAEVGKAAHFAISLGALNDRLAALETGRALKPEDMVPDGYVLQSSDVMWHGPEQDIGASRIRIERSSEYIKYAPRSPFANPECAVRAWRDDVYMYLVVDGVEVAHKGIEWGVAHDGLRWTIAQFEKSSFTELPREEALALYREWKASKGDV